MTLKLNGSSSGSVSIDAPASTTGGADVTLTLPVNDGDADQVLKTDGSGNLSFGAAGGITSAQQFRLAADQGGSSSAGTVITNWEENDTDYQAIASNWSQSSGIFSCSATGIYLVSWTLVITGTNTGDAYDPNVQISTDTGGSYTTRSRSWGHISNSSSLNRVPVQNQFIVDVANTSTFRLRVRESEDNDISSGTTIGGDSNSCETNILFIRLGAT